ncbi:hypothetical protein PPSIR1_23439 [Plesiocystis pacifica SIR-1]|uniref:Tyr recombinase domain-containing protein n=2 Tax=Plesiocystis pacifica TaxID=191768 RepID=A6G7T0_9BACT|nr:hypothetical protein PPSIR1_23439 [Plesiocystis pacifica SIR-1]
MTPESMEGATALDFEEAKLFLEGARVYERGDGMWHVYMPVALRTGLRVGEMKALRWRDDIDLRRGRLRVQRSHHKSTASPCPRAASPVSSR